MLTQPFSSNRLFGSNDMSASKVYHTVLQQNRSMEWPVGSNDTASSSERAPLQQGVRLGLYSKNIMQ